MALLTKWCFLYKRNQTTYTYGAVSYWEIQTITPPPFLRLTDIETVHWDNIHPFDDCDNATMRQGTEQPRTPLLRAKSYFQADSGRLEVTIKPPIPWTSKVRVKLTRYRKLYNHYRNALSAIRPFPFNGDFTGAYRYLSAPIISEATRNSPLLSLCKRMHRRPVDHSTTTTPTISDNIDLPNNKSLFLPSRDWSLSTRFQIKGFIEVYPDVFAVNYQALTPNRLSSFYMSTFLNYSAITSQ